ncbi:MAG: LamG domain-containing protein [Pedosphaera sp.]|nr:LamG domain-containing protein [Pedosphaera sp.]
MNPDRHRFLKPGEVRLPASRWFVSGICPLLAGFWLLPFSVQAATFSGNASISANDSTNALSANPANNLLTVSCWFKLVVPSGTNITENMTILMDRTDGNEAQNFSYLLRFNATTGVIEYLTRGATGAYTNTLIARPYLDRWYHVAVVRQNSLLYFYVDGRALSPDAAIIGSAVGGGLSIGGITGNSQLFRGEIIEVAVYRAVLDADTIRQRMFRDQRTFANLTGYYKLGFSTNSADLYRNFVPLPPQGTDPATKQGAGTIEFEETDQAGEQSTFDSRKNHGQDALTPLSGASGWSQTAFARAVPGISFDLRFGYSSGTPTLPPTDGGIDPYNPRVLGLGWRQSFDTRIFTETSLTEFKLLTWDGSIETWTRTNSSSPLRTRHNEYRGELVETNGGFEWTTPDRLVYRFQDPTDATLMAGRLREIRDFNGNAAALLWNEDEGYVTNVVDTAGGRYIFN